MFRKIIYVFLGFFATVFALNVETGFNDGIMNVTLYEVEGLAQGECGDNGFTECPDRSGAYQHCNAYKNKACVRLPSAFHSV